MVGLVPCAGRGSRLSLPFSKEMFPDINHHAYRPIIMYTIEAMRLAGIRHIIFTINPRKSDLLQFLGNGKQFDMSFTYCVHPEPLSLPESINEAYHLIQDKVVVFAMPDTTIVPIDFMAQLIDFHTTHKIYELSVGCFKTDNPTKFGMVEFQDDVVVRFIDKPSHTHLQWMWGAMVWDPAVAREFHAHLSQAQNKNLEQELCLTDTLTKLVQSRKVGACRFHNGIYRDLGTYDEIVKWSESTIS